MECLVQTRAAATPAEAGARRDAAWSLFALAAGHFAVDCCSGIWPVFKTVAHLDLARAGLIATTGSMAGNGLQLAFGRLADRGGRKRLLVVGAASAAAITLIPWATGSYLAMALLVMAGQIGSAAFHPSAAGAAATLSQRRAGLLLGLFFAGGYLGYSLSQFLFTAVYNASPKATPLIALLPFAAAAAIAVRVPPTARAASARGVDHAALRRVRRSLAALFAVQACTGTVNLTLVFLLPDLLVQRHAARWMAEGGGHFALVAGGALALLPAGATADRWGARGALTVANVVSVVWLVWLLSRGSASPLDLLLVLAFGVFNGVNSVVAVSEGSRLLPGHASTVSALLMGLPWCVAALGPVIAGLLADPGRGGTPAGALAWFALLIPAALLAARFVRPRREPPLPA